MSVEVLCDQCRVSFEGQDWMEETTICVLCPECYSLANEEI